MKLRISILFLSAITGLGAHPDSIQRVTLDERVVITVPVSTNRVTTLSFPGPIAAIDAVGVTADSKTPGEFQLGYTKGSAFVSVRALARKARTNLNIRWNKRTYVFELEEGDTPVLALNLEDRPMAETAQPAPQVTPTRLLAILDKAKAFPLLKRQQPDAVAGAEARTFGNEPQISDFNDYEIRVEEVFRFNPEDTLVFNVTLRNKSEREVRYLPESFCVRVGNRLYHQSISDAPGLLPPHAASKVYFAITGTPDGGRNELSLKNEFIVSVSRLSLPPREPTTQSAAPTHSPPLPPSAETTPQSETPAIEAFPRLPDVGPTNSPSAKQIKP